jgi:hypothetical protein
VVHAGITFVPGTLKFYPQPVSFGESETVIFYEAECAYGFTAKWLGKAVEMGHNQGGTRKVG